MATPVLMPRQGQSVESCILIEWLVKPGDTVEVGQNLANIETDKAVFEVEAPEAGTVLALFCEPGDDIPVLTAIAALGEPGEDAGALRPADTPPGDPAPAPAVPPADLPTQPEPAATPSAGAGISPRARGLAARTGVEASLLAGSGPGGRVLERDVLSASSTAGETGEKPVVIKVSGIRKKIAERMTASLSSTAQYTVSRRFNARSLQALRAGVKARIELDGGADINVNDMILYAVSRVLSMHPALNAHCLGDRILQFAGVNIGVAVDTPRGLMVPVIPGVDRMSLEEISRAVRPAIETCREGRADLDLLQGGTFTVSNLGSLGIEVFTPVLNTPEVAILGVGSIVPAPAASESGGIEMVPTMTLSLTADHRAVDGAPAARFLGDLCAYLEQIETHLTEPQL